LAHSFASNSASRETDLSLHGTPFLSIFTRACFYGRSWEWSVLDWITKNASWLFEGLGVAVLSFVGSMCAFVWHKSKRRRTPAEPIHASSTLEPRSAFERISSLTLAEIEDAIRAAPPLHRDTVVKRFNGSVIQWTGMLTNVHRAGDGYVDVGLHIKGRWLSVWSKVRLCDYPELNVARYGTPITITARIKDDGEDDFVLVDALLSFPTAVRIKSAAQEKADAER
jgi:hypothetical protein